MLNLCIRCTSSFRLLVHGIFSWIINHLSNFICELQLLYMYLCKLIVNDIMIIDLLTIKNFANSDVIVFLYLLLVINPKQPKLCNSQSLSVCISWYLLYHVILLILRANEVVPILYNCSISHPSHWHSPQARSSPSPVSLASPRHAAITRQYWPAVPWHYPWACPPLPVPPWPTAWTWPPIMPLLYRAWPALWPHWPVL